jgi:hypothetical protein
MLVRARRPTAFLCIALLAQNLVACYHIAQEPRTIIPSGGVPPMEKLVGVTLNDGRVIRFDKNSRPVLSTDSLQVEVANRPLAIPMSDVQRLWIRSISSTRTTLLVGGVTLAALGLLLTLRLSQAVKVY